MVHILKKIHWSNYLIFVFAFVLLLLGSFAELLQGPPLLPSQIGQLVQNPLIPQQFEKLTKVKITNKRGTFQFQNLSKDKDLLGPWAMTKPTYIRPKKDLIDNLVGSLIELSIKAIHPLDPINLASFSLDKPLYSITFENNSFQKIELNFGLINPIDNTTYFMINGQDWIYQTSLPPATLESSDALDFISNHVFAFNSQQVTSLEVQKSPFNTPSLKIIKEGDIWLDGTTKDLLNTLKATNFINEFIEIRSYMILDRLDEEQKQELDQYLEKPLYLIKIGTANKTESFYLTELVERIGNLKFEKGKSYILYKEENLFPLVIQSDFYNILNNITKTLK